MPPNIEDSEHDITHLIDDGEAGSWLTAMPFLSCEVFSSGVQPEGQRGAAAPNSLGISLTIKSGSKGNE